MALDQDELDRMNSMFRSEQEDEEPVQDIKLAEPDRARMDSMFGSEKDKDLSNSLNLGVQRNPAEAAEDGILSQYAGMPISLINPIRDKVKADKRVDEITTALRGSKTTSEWMKDPDNAAMASDDVENLTGIERTLGFWDYVGKGLQAVGLAPGDEQVGQAPPRSITGNVITGAAKAVPSGMSLETWSRLEWKKDFGGGLTPEEEKRHIQAKEEFLAHQQSLQSEDLDTRWGADAGQLAGQQISTIIDAMSGEGLEYGLTFAAGGAGVGAVGGTAAGPGSLVTVPAGAAAGAAAMFPVGFGVGTTAGYTVNTMQALYGEAKMDFVDEYKLSEEDARTASLIYMAMAMPLELGGQALAAKLVPGLDKVAGKAGLPLIAEALRNKSAGSVALKALKDWVLNATYQGVEEGLQKGMVVGIREWMKETGESLEVTAEDFKAMLEEGLMAFRGSLLLGGAGPSVQIVNAQETAEKTNNEQRKLDRFSQQSAASTLRQTNPEKFKELVRQIGGESGTSTIYMEQEAAQKLLQDDEEVITTPLGEEIDRQLKKNGESGDYVEIPIETYAAEIAGQPIEGKIRPFVKMTVESFTQNEEAQTDIEAQIKAINEMDVQRLTDEAKVFQSVNDELIKAGFDPDTANKHAVYYEAVFRTKAKQMQRAGHKDVTALSLYEQYVGGVQREMPPELREKVAAETAFDAVVDRIRAGEELGGEAVYGDALTTFVKKAKRKQTIDGETRSLTTQEIAVRAHEAGYISEPTEKALNEALEKKIEVFSPKAANADMLKAKQTMDEVRELLDDAGLNPSVMSNQEIREALAGIQEGDLQQFQNSVAFNRWFGNSKVVNIDGTPMVVYHGTVNDYDAFDMGRRTSGNLGRGFYFTDSTEDANENYAGEGPDLTMRIELLAERIEQGDDFEGDHDAAVELARKQLSEGRPNVMPVHLSMRKPVVIGNGIQSETFFDYTEEYDEETEEYGEPSGDLIDIIDKMRLLSVNYDSIDIDGLIGEIYERAIDDQGISASDLLELITQSPNAQYMTDAEGELAGNEFMSEVFQSLGYDGFIDYTVYNKFGPNKKLGSKGMKGLYEDTAHYIVFKPTQIKSAIGNNGNYDPNDSNILYQQDGDNTNVDTPEQIASDKEWAAWEPNKTKTGKYKGAPPNVKTKKDLAKLRADIRAMAMEGHPARYWYEDSGAAVIKIMSGDPVEAEKFAQLLAIYSPQSNVNVNTFFAMKAWMQYKSGQTREEFGQVKTGAQDEKAKKVLYDNDKWAGRKTSSFNANLLTDVIEDMTAAPRVTVDLWVLRAYGYPVAAASDDKKDGKYSFAENDIRRLTAQLNLEREPGTPRYKPHQVQAMLWASIKGRRENKRVKDATNAESLRLGYSKIDKKTGKLVNPTSGRKYLKHNELWLKTAKELLTPEEVTASIEVAKKDFSDYLEGMTGVVTWETEPSPAFDAEISKASPEVRALFNSKAAGILFGENGKDLLAEQLGVLVSFANPGMGGYEGGVSPNMLSHLIPEKTGPGFTPDQVRQYAQAIQYIYKQNAVPWFRANSSALSSQAAIKDQKFKVVNTATGKVVPGASFDLLADATAMAESKGDGFRVQGGKYARGVVLKLMSTASSTDLQKMLQLLGNYGIDGLTLTAPDEVTIINFRDDTTKVPFVDDEVFFDRIEAFLGENVQGLGISDHETIWTEGEYGYVHDWKEAPTGEEILERSFAGSPDLQAWIRDRRAEYEQVLAEFSGEQLAAREKEVAVLSGRRPAALFQNDTVADGDQYFDPEALAKEQRNSGKFKSSEVLVHLSPDEFLALAERGFDESKEKTVSGVLESGGKFSDIPFLKFGHDGEGTAFVTGHEGRHRAMQLKKLGVKSMPVVMASVSGGKTYNSTGGGKIRWSEQDDPSTFDYIKNWPTVIESENGDVSPFPLTREGTRTSETLKSVDGNKLQPRGYFNPKSRKITLTPRANLSTFLHETGHLFLEMYRDLAPQSPEIQADLDTLMKWGGYEGQAFDSLTDDEYRNLHEKFASGFEAYLFEGKAPTAELQSVFDAFSAWLAFIYKAAKSIFDRNNLSGTELSDEVRAVMDRLAATQEEIDNANASMKYEALPIDEMGLEEEQVAEYRKALLDSQQEASRELTAKAMEEIHRQRESWWKKELAEKMASVREDLENTKDYVTRMVLTGKTDAPSMKLDTEYVTAVYGESIAEKLKGMTKKGGLHPDQAGPLLGYASGEELVMAMANSMNKQQADEYVKAEAQRLMEEEHGNMLVDGSIADEAKKAVHNEKQSRLHMLELKLLNSKLGKKFAAAGIDRNILALYKEAAKQAILSMPWKAINPHRHLVQEQKYGRDVARFAMQGNWREARVAKHKQIRQFFLYKEALIAKEKGEKIRAKLAKIKTKKFNPKFVNPNYIQQVKVLLSLFDTRKTPNKKDIDLKLERVNKFLTAQAESNPGLIAGAYISQIKDWRSMSLPELEALLDAVSNLISAGESQSENEYAALKAEAEAAAASVLASTDEKAPNQNINNPTWLEKFGSWSKRVTEDQLALYTDIRMFDGYETMGVWYRNVMKPIIDGTNRRIKMDLDAAKQLYAMFRPFGGKLSRTVTKQVKAAMLTGESLDSGIVSRKTEGGRTLTLSAGERVMLAVYWGSPESREAILSAKLKGVTVTENDVQVMLDLLTPDQKALVKKIWEFNEQYWKESVRIQQKLTGVAPVKVDHIPFKAGDTVMPGGYQRIYYHWNPKDKNQVDMHEADEASLNVQNRIKQSKTGAMIERVGAGGREIKLDTGNVVRAADDMIQFLSFAEASHDVARFMNHSAVKSSVVEAYGNEKYQSFMDTVGGVFAGNVVPTDVFSKALRYVRTNLGIGFLTLSLRNMVQQPTALANSFGRNGEVNTIKGMLSIIVAPVATVKWINSVSVAMQQRNKLINREISDAQQVLANQAKQGWISQRKFVLQVVADAVAVYPTWMASYYTGLEKVAKPGMSKDAIKQAAIEYADQETTTLMGSGLKKDQSPVFQGTGQLAKSVGGEMVKQLTFMGTFFGLNYNLFADAWSRARKGKISKAQYTREMFWYLVVPAIISKLLVERLPDDDDDEGWAEWMAKAVIEYGLSASMLMRNFASAFKGFDSTIPGFAAFGSVADLWKEFVQGMDEEEEFGLDDAADVIRAVQPLYPMIGSGQVARSLDQLHEVQEGNEDPSAVNMLIKGKEKK